MPRPLDPQVNAAQVLSRRMAALTRLPREERLDVVRGVGAILVISVLVHVAGLTRTIRVVQSRALRGGHGTQCIDQQATRRVVVGVERAATVVPCRCLVRSVASRWLLGRRGVYADLIFGVRADERSNRIDAHAWLEVQGVPINDQPDVNARFAVLEGARGRICFDQSGTR